MGPINREMPQRALTIKNSLGLHLRPASLLVIESGKYKSQILISKDGMKADGKSIIGIVALAAGKGSTIIIEATGEDAEEALDALEDLVTRRKFDEK